VNRKHRTRSAIYLVGHGPYRQPRFIELQYLRISRYRNLLDEASEADVFIDLNIPRLPDAPLRANELPEFVRLHEAVKAKQYSAVYVDLEIGSGFKPYEFMFVPQLLEAAGSKVFNAFYDDGNVLEAALKQRYGDHARADEIDDASDFLNFFPAFAGMLRNGHSTDDPRNELVSCERAAVFAGPHSRRFRFQLASRPSSTISRLCR